MFTGIIEDVGRIESTEEKGKNRTFWISSTIGKDLKADQSVSHDGICLTVEETDADRYRVTAIEETISKTTAGNWKKNGLVNLERCLIMNGRLDGHLVQGHVDGTGILTGKKELSGSWQLDFSFPAEAMSLIIEKGSIAINGISLTCFNVSRQQFSVAIIPFTFDHTNIKFLETGDPVNLEFDMVGKYINRFLNVTQQGKRG